MIYTDKQIIKAMQGTGGIISQILKNLTELDERGISRQALHERLKKNESLQEAYIAEQERIGDIAETGFFRALQKEEDWAIKEWFKYKGWSRDYVVKQSINNNVTMNPVDLLLKEFGIEATGGEDDRKGDEPISSSSESQT